MLMFLLFTEKFGVKVKHALEFKRLDVEKLFRADLG
jgi:hypothetical protein